MKKKTVLIVLIVVIGLVGFLLYPRPVGYIKVDTPGAVVCLKPGWWSQKLIRGTEPAAIRAGTYSPKFTEICQEVNGDKWKIQSYGPWGTLAKIQVKKEETTLLKFGPPLTVKTDVNRRGQVVSISYSIVGQVGEHYYLRIQKNGKQQPVPKLKIVDEAGKVLASGRFEYG